MQREKTSVPKPTHLIVLIPILLLAFGLRVWDLAEHNLWWDEGIGVWVARLPLWEGVRWTATDSHPPLHYMVLHLWRRVAGEGEYVLRFPSVVAGFLTVVLTYRLGRSLGGDATGVLAALLVALSRFSIVWSQEVRMYGLATTLSTASLWAAIELWKQGLLGLPGNVSATSERSLHVTGRQRTRARALWPWLPWSAYVALTSGALFTLYLTGTLMIVTNLGFLAIWWLRIRADSGPARMNRRFVWPWVTAQIAVVVLMAPWMAYALRRMHSLSADQPFNARFFLQLYATMLTVGSPLNLDRNLPWVLFIGGGLILGVVALITRFKQRGDTARKATSWRTLRWGQLVMLLSGLLLPPLAIVAVASPQLNLGFSRSVAPRYLLPLSTCYPLLLTWGITTLAERSHVWQNTKPGKAGRAEERDLVWPIVAAIVASTAALAAVSGLQNFYSGRARRDDYVTIAEVLRGHRHPTDAVVLYVDRDWPIFAAHYAGPRHDLAYGADLSDPQVVEHNLAPIWETASAVWLVSTPESLQADPSQGVIAWLADRAAITKTIVSGENTLTLYARSELDSRVRETILPGYRIPTPVTTPHSLVGIHLPLPRYKSGDTVHLGIYMVPPLPPGVEVVIDNGQQIRRFTVESPSADLNIARSQCDIPLTPDLNGGTYTISVEVPGYAATIVGTFDLITASVDDAINAAGIPQHTAVTFGESIELVGYALPEDRVAVGEAVALTLYWRTTAPLTTRYKVFTHLLGETFNAHSSNFLWGQQDNEPGMGQMQTTLWPTDTIIADHYRIPVDTSAPPGVYTLEIGMYGLVDGVRLPASAEGLPVHNDAVLLTTIRVVE